MKYKWCTKFKLPVVTKHNVDYIPRTKLQMFLARKKIQHEFGKLFGIQTQLISGPYAWDVEAVFVRMFEGRRTGTQLIPD